MNDEHRWDPMDLEAAIDQIRTELLGEDESELPAERELEVPPRTEPCVSEESSEIIDALIAESADVDERFRSRVLAALESRLSDRRRRSGRLEPFLKTDRLLQERPIEELAESLELSLEEFQRLEDGLAPLTSYDEQLIARWILALEADEGAAIAALERSDPSALASDRSYAGRQRAGRKPRSDFVDRVVEAIAVLKSEGSNGDS